MIFLNFKTYQETSGVNTVKLCQLIAKVSQETKVKIVACLQAIDIFRVKQSVDVEIWSQHADPVGFGKHTGWLSPVSLKNSGAVGTIINHSEHPVNLEVIKNTVSVCRQQDFKTMVCASSIEMIKQMTNLNPDYIAYEDPQLIGGPVAMIEANQDLVKEAVAVSQQPVIVGGGIRSQNHVEQTLNLGGAGVLVASEFAKSSNPEATLKDLISGFSDQRTIKV